MASPSSVKRTADPTGDDIATLVTGGKHAQVVSPAPLITRYAQASSTVAYAGQADPGTLTSAASWRVYRLTTVGEDVILEYADGNANFDNVWDNRASLSYS